MNSDKIKILLVDDDKLIRMSLKIIIEADSELQVIGQADNGKAAVSQYTAQQPDVLLMDIRMQPMDGLQAGETILRHDSAARILYLTTFADDEYIIRALRLGARGYILKQDFEIIVPAIKAVNSGQNVFGDTIMARIPELMRNADKVDLSCLDIRDKEAEIICLVAEGLNNREIAARLFLSEGTVRNHLSVILDKLGLRDRTQLAIFYYRHKHGRVGEM